MAGEVLLVKNLDDRPFVGKWANVKYTVPPGQQRICPQEGVHLWFGHPDTVDVDQTRKYRTDEFERLRYKYGAGNGDPELWEANKPKVEVYTVDGDRVITVIDDPDGLHLTPDIQTKTENTLLHDRIAKMERELSALRRASLVDERAEVARQQGVAVTEDANPSLPQPPDQTTATEVHSYNARNDVPDLPREVTEDSPVKVRTE